MKEHKESKLESKEIRLVVVPDRHVTWESSDRMNLSVGTSRMKLFMSMHDILLTKTQKDCWQETEWSL